MKLTSTRLWAIALSILFIFSACEDEVPPAVIDGFWGLDSMFVESETEFVDRGSSVPHDPCFYNGDTVTPREPITTLLRLNANQSGNLNWETTCVDAERFNFNWEYSGNNTLVMNRTTGGQWTWTITSLNQRDFEATFYQETPMQLSVGAALYKETFTLKFNRIE